MGLGGAFCLFGLWVLFLPSHFVSVVNWESRQGLYLSAGIRIVAGLVLLLSAAGTRYPTGLRIFGGLVLLAGLALPFVPLDFWAGFIHWWVIEGLAIFRFTAGIIGLLFGAFLIYSAQPNQTSGEG
jgi:hypothetical protein